MRGRPVLCCFCPSAPRACLMLALHLLSNVATQAQTARYLLGEPPDIEADEDVALAWSRFCAWLSACAPTPDRFPMSVPHWKLHTRLETLWTS